MSATSNAIRDAWYVKGQGHLFSGRTDSSDYTHNHSFELTAHIDTVPLEGSPFTTEEKTLANHFAAFLIEHGATSKFLDRLALTLLTRCRDCGGKGYKYIDGSNESGFMLDTITCKTCKGTGGVE